MGIAEVWDAVLRRMGPLAAKIYQVSLGEVAVWQMPRNSEAGSRILKDRGRRTVLPGRGKWWKESTLEAYHQPREAPRRYLGGLLTTRKGWGGVSFAACISVVARCEGKPRAGKGRRLPIIRHFHGQW